MSSILNSLKSLASSHSGKNEVQADVRPVSPPSEESDFNQWVHAMRLVAGLPGGVPPEFRRKLWLSLAEKHLQNNKVDWPSTEKRCFSAFNREDDEELGNQIVKDLHRTGSSLFSGPEGAHNQAILKKVLIGYARYNESVGYCQGFNMLGAFMLQVMERSEVDSLKVMIFLIEGVMPPKYFSGTLSGLITDMSVFRELLANRLPKLSTHLDRLQGTDGEGYSFEPPLTNVFTMQWFLTLFCTCLPHATVLRVWDLIFLEGNEILLRTALMIWECFSERILSVKSADEFYSIMVVLSKEMLEYGFKDANTFIKKVMDFGPISHVHDLRAKYNYNIKWTQSVQPTSRERIKLFYSDDESYSDSEPNRMAVTAAYGWSSTAQKPPRKNSLGSLMMDPDRLTMDINALKQQYLKLRERQRQAHLILTAACARQTVGSSMSSPSSPINHFLLGKSAILSTHGRRIGPARGSVPPPRIVRLSMQAAQGETLHWKDTDSKRRTLTRTDSIKWKDIPKCQTQVTSNNNSINADSRYDDEAVSTSCAESAGEGDGLDYNDYMQDYQRHGDSSSYSDDSHASSSSTELCDEPNRLGDFDQEPSASKETAEATRTEGAFVVPVYDEKQTDANEYASAGSPVYDQEDIEQKFHFDTISREISRDDLDDNHGSSYVPEVVIENIALTIQENKNLLSRVTEDRFKEITNFTYSVDADYRCKSIANEDISLENNAMCTENVGSEPEVIVRSPSSAGSYDHTKIFDQSSSEPQIKLTDEVRDDYAGLSSPAREFSISICQHTPICTCSRYDFQEAGKKNSERALQIIEENSKILHRISQYNIQSTDTIAFDQISRTYTWKYDVCDESTAAGSSESHAEIAQNNECISRSNSRYGLNFTKFTPATEPHLTFKNYFIDKEKLSPIYRLNSDDKNIFNIPSSANVVSDVSFSGEPLTSSEPLTFDYKFPQLHDHAETEEATDAHPPFRDRHDDNAVKTSSAMESGDILTKSTYDKSCLSLSSDFEYVLRKDLPSSISPITSTSISSELRESIRNPYSSILSPGHFPNFQSVLSMDNNFTTDSKSAFDYTSTFMVDYRTLAQNTGSCCESGGADASSRLSFSKSPIKETEPQE